MGYIDVPITTDAEQIRTDIYAALQEEFPDWEPADGNLEVWLIEGFAAIAADLKTLAADVPPAIFRQFGRSILKAEPQDDVAATANSTWTAVDAAGYTIRAGTQVQVALTGNEFVGFEVVSDVTIPPGNTATGAGEVELVATETGDRSNGASGSAQLLTSLSWVSSVALVGESSGGADAETDDEFMDRLSDRLRLLSPRPILPQDFAELAKDNPSVVRALAVDGYNPDDGTTDNERMVAVAVHGEDGANLSSGIRGDIEDYLEAAREANFLCPVFNPTKTTINTVSTVRCYPGFDPSVVEASVQSAQEAYLDPGAWGQEVGDPTAWRRVTKVRYNELIQLISNVAGVDYVESLTVNSGTADVNLTGQAPLTQPGTIAVTANPAT